METKIYDPSVPWQVEACLAYVCGYNPLLFPFCVILYGDVSDVDSCSLALSYRSRSGKALCCLDVCGQSDELMRRVHLNYAAYTFRNPDDGFAEERPRHISRCV